VRPLFRICITKLLRKLSELDWKSQVFKLKSNYKNYTISAINYLDFYDNLLIFKYRHTNSLQIVIKIYNNFYDKNFLIPELINKANSRLLSFFIERKKN